MKSVIEPSISFDITAARISDIVIAVSIVPSTLLFPLMLWLILRHSRKMGKYRWYMLINVVFCYAFDVWLTLVKPVFLGPLLGWYLQGFVPANSAASCFLVGVLIYLSSAMEFSMGCSLLYRFAQSYFGLFRDFFEGHKISAVYAVIIVGSIIGFSPLLWVRFDSDDAMRRYAIAYSASLPPLTNINGFFVYERTVIAECFLCVVVVNMLGCAVLLGRLYFVFLLRLRSRRFKESQSKSNYRLQMMLFRTITFQLVVGVILLFLPTVAALTILALNVPHSGAATTLLVTAISLHASIEFAGICYFVAPYRRAILRVIEPILNRKAAGVPRREATSATLFTVA